MKIKTADLIGPALDWAVMKIEGRVLVQTLGGGLLVNGRHEDGRELPEDWQMTFMWHPSTDWEQGGPIIEREKIDISYWTSGNAWHAPDVCATTAKVNILMGRMGIVMAPLRSSPPCAASLPQGSVMKWMCRRN